MKKNPVWLFLLFIMFSAAVYSQPANSSAQKNADTTLVNELLQKSKDSLSNNPNIAIELAVKANDLAKQINYKKEQPMH